MRQGRTAIVFVLCVLLTTAPVLAGIAVVGSNGITATGADGVQFTGLTGITATGADGVLTFGPNGITATGADGITATGADGITATGADGYTYTGANGITATGADSLLINNADGITATGADGITATGADGTTYRADAIDIKFPNGITATGADGITATGVRWNHRQLVRILVRLQMRTGLLRQARTESPFPEPTALLPLAPTVVSFQFQLTILTLAGADLLVVANAHGISLSGADYRSETGVELLSTH